MDEFLSDKELFALVEVMIGARAFSQEELSELTSKLKHFTTPQDSKKLNELIRKELYHYPEVKHDCESVQDNLWQLMNCITEKKEISIDENTSKSEFIIAKHRNGPTTTIDLFRQLLPHIRHELLHVTHIEFNVYLNCAMSMCFIQFMESNKRVEKILLD